VRFFVCCVVPHQAGDAPGPSCQERVGQALDGSGGTAEHAWRAKEQRWKTDKRRRGDCVINPRLAVRRGGRGKKQGAGTSKAAVGYLDACCVGDARSAVASASVASVARRRGVRVFGHPQANPTLAGGYCRADERAVSLMCSNSMNG